jgi:hypothetical protein
MTICQYLKEVFSLKALAKLISIFVFEINDHSGKITHAIQGKI